MHSSLVYSLTRLICSDARTKLRLIHHTTDIFTEIEKIALQLRERVEYFHFITSLNVGPTLKCNIHNQVCQKVVSMDSAFM